MISSLYVRLRTLGPILASGLTVGTMPVTGQVLRTLVYNNLPLSFHSLRAPTIINKFHDILSMLRAQSTLATTTPIYQNSIDPFTG